MNKLETCPPRAEANNQKIHYQQVMQAYLIPVITYPRLINTSNKPKTKIYSLSTIKIALLCYKFKDFFS